MKTNEQPMGVSQWRELGKKYGYWEYFEKALIKSAEQKVLMEAIERIEDNPFYGDGVAISILKSLKEEK